MAEPILQMTGVRKSFGAIQALRGVDLTVAAGEVHALIGENGAGKSTLMKILSGAQPPDSGEIRFAGQPCRLTGPADARARGIAMIYQELTLAPHLTVAGNVILGREGYPWGLIHTDRARIRAALALLGHPGLDLDLPVRQLSIGEQQIVEIARALMLNARLLIMDEPTSSLSAADTEALFQAIKRLRERGVSLIYISHFLEEVRRVSDRYTVIRDGAHVGSGEIAATPIPELIRQMVGRPLDEMFPQVPHQIGTPALRVRGLCAAGVQPASFELRRGEILGLAGLVGSGRSALLRALFGLNPAPAGDLEVFGNPLSAKGLTPRLALARGIELLSENRKDEGLAVKLPVRENMTLSSLPALVHGAWPGLIHRRRERHAVQEQVKALAIRLRDIMQPASGLSGGNQQKVAIGRILVHGSEILLLDEPTRGIDVGSKAEIYRLIGQLAAAGKAIVVVSSYLPELFGVCDTLAVMHRGRLSAKRPLAAWTQETVMVFATSGEEPPPPQPL